MLKINLILLGFFFLCVKMRDLEKTVQLSQGLLLFYSVSCSLTDQHLKRPRGGGMPGIFKEGHGASVKEQRGG